MSAITIFGAGSWGTALAHSAAVAGHSVCLWCRRPEQAHAISTARRNPVYLSDVELSSRIHATGDIREAALFSPLWVLALPTQSLRGFLPSLSPSVSSGTELCNVAKGMETTTAKRISEIVSELLPCATYSVLSGPSFAEEVIRGLPTAVTVASQREASSMLWQALLSTPSFRIYTSMDVAGTEIGGAVKNVMAIASGVSTVCGLGDNARAGLVSRGLSEIMRLGEALGAHPLTLAGLSGVGDLVLTCYSEKSRNYRLGMAVGGGASLAQAEERIGQVSEGAYTVQAMVRLSDTLEVELPISRAVYRLLYEGASPQGELQRLMTRDLKAEYPPSILWGREDCPGCESRL